MKAFLDTHAAVALAEDPELLGRRARHLVERSALFVSPMVRLELSFLHQIGRLAKTPEAIIESLITNVGLFLSSDSVADVVTQAVDLEWTRDPFDRLLVATARLHKAPLITRDRNILENFPDAVW